MEDAVDDEVRVDEEGTAFVDGVVEARAVKDSTDSSSSSDEVLPTMN